MRINVLKLHLLPTALIADAIAANRNSLFSAIRYIWELDFNVADHVKVDHPCTMERRRQNKEGKL